MQIRRFQKTDATQASKIIRENLQNITSKKLPSKVIETIVEHYAPERLIENSKTHCYFVHIENEEVLGIGGYKNGEVHTFYIDIQNHHRGI